MVRQRGRVVHSNVARVLDLEFDYQNHCRGLAFTNCFSRVAGYDNVDAAVACLSWRGGVLLLPG